MKITRKKFLGALLASPSVAKALPQQATARPTAPLELDRFAYQYRPYGNTTVFRAIPRKTVVHVAVARLTGTLLYKQIRYGTMDLGEPKLRVDVHTRAVGASATDATLMYALYGRQAQRFLEWWK